MIEDVVAVLLLNRAFSSNTHSTEMVQRNRSIRAVLSEGRGILHLRESVLRLITASTAGLNKCELGGSIYYTTVLDF